MLKDVIKQSKEQAKNKNKALKEVLAIQEKIALRLIVPVAQQIIEEIGSDLLSTESGSFLDHQKEKHLEPYKKLGPFHDVYVFPTNTYQMFHLEVNISEINCVKLDLKYQGISFAGTRTLMFRRDTDSKSEIVVPNNFLDEEKNKELIDCYSNFYHSLTYPELSILLAKLKSLDNKEVLDSLSKAFWSDLETTFVEIYSKTI